VQVVRIFTDMSISPSLSPRQYPNRYAFRAGRNFKDERCLPFEESSPAICAVRSGQAAGSWFRRSRNV